MKTAIVLPLLAAASLGCTAQGVRPTSNADPFTFHNFNAPIAQRLSVNTGDALLVEGKYIEGEEITVSAPVDLMIPGSMLIPFPVHIDAGSLAMRRITPEWKYYCAESGKAAASFPGLGSVLRDGDCVGIRISTSGSQSQWVVDNSNYNRGHGETIWTKSMSAEDAQRHAPRRSATPFQIESLVRLVFDGFYGGQLHFSWEALTASSKDTREFVFDFDGQPTQVGIKGNLFRVHEANNVKLVYEWQRFQ